MKIKQKIKQNNTTNNVKSLQIKRGHTKLILRDIHTGKEEVYEDDNMQTNAINEMLVDCGWLNRDNLDQNNLATQLLGGVMMFDQTITEDATIIDAPNGCTMIANASYGVSSGTSASDPTEMGSYTAGESGWEGNTLVLQYDWLASQGNSSSPIKCICATGKDWGYVGEGNAQSVLSRSSKVTPQLYGVITEYYVSGYPCRLSILDSSIYTVDFSDLANGNLTIRKYRLPLTKVNLRGTQSNPVILSEVTISAPEHMTSSNIHVIRDTGNKLMVNNSSTSTSAVWGTDYTQYLWEIDPVTATATETVIANTSGTDELKSMCNCVWMGDDCVAFISGTEGYITRDGRKIYSMKRTNGTWGNIQVCDSPFGIYGNRIDTGWYHSVRTWQNRALVYGQYYSGEYYYNELMFDYDLNKCWLTNGTSQRSGELGAYSEVHDAPMICYQRYLSTSNPVVYRIRINRHQACIATINNLASPVQKTPDKSMTLQYTFEFIEDDEE